MQMNSLFFIILGFFLFTGILISVFLIIFLRKQIREEIKDSQDQFLKLAKGQFESEQKDAVRELETRKIAVETSVKGLEEELEKYKKLMHDFEKDRDTKYGNLETSLKDVSENTSKLQETTNRLNNILGNVKLRGQWGERMAEDIIKYAGLAEGINYKKQTKLGSVSTKPDYTFLLPNDHTINMDVKFPLDNYLNMVNAQDSTEKERFQKDFVRNVKDRIKEIQNRDYINPAENTLDFVLLFIPNEQVFGIIQEKIPGIMDDSLKQKVVLCSPFTLYAMLSVIRQAYENFRYEKDIKKIIQLIEQFANIYETFKLRFEDIGEKIEKLGTTYDDVKDKSFKQLDTKIKHIDGYKTGNQLVLGNDTNRIIGVSSENKRDDAIVQ